MKKLSYIFFLALALQGCAYLSAYTKDRFIDVLDTASVSVEGIGLGAEILISSASLGAMVDQGYSLGIRGGQVGIFDITSMTALSGVTPHSESENTAHHQVFKGVTGDRLLYLRNKKYGDYIPGPIYLGGRIGFRVCALLCVHAEINSFEMLDLVFGFLTIDILDDDYYIQREEIRKRGSKKIHSGGEG